jgi:hypothetical protein
MTHGHYRELCRHCSRVTRQCRCASPNKRLRLTTCTRCLAAGVKTDPVGDPVVQRIAHDIEARVTGRRPDSENPLVQSYNVTLDALYSLRVAIDRLQRGES